MRRRPPATHPAFVPAPPLAFLALCRLRRPSATDSLRLPADRTRALNFRSTFRECRSSFAPGCGPGEDWVTMPQFFVSALLRAPLPSRSCFARELTVARCRAQKNAGYWTSSAGKVFHDGMDDPIS